MLHLVSAANKPAPGKRCQLRPARIQTHPAARQKPHHPDSKMGWGLQWEMESGLELELNLELDFLMYDRTELQIPYHRKAKKKSVLGSAGAQNR